MGYWTTQRIPESNVYRLSEATVLWVTSYMEPPFAVKVSPFTRLEIDSLPAQFNVQKSYFHIDIDQVKIESAIGEKTYFYLDSAAHND